MHKYALAIFTALVTSCGGYVGVGGGSGGFGAGVSFPIGGMRTPPPPQPPASAASAPTQPKETQ